MLYLTIIEIALASNQAPYKYLNPFFEYRLNNKFSEEFEKMTPWNKRASYITK